MSKFPFGSGEITLMANPEVNAPSTLLFHEGDDAHTITKIIIEKDGKKRDYGFSDTGTYWYIQKITGLTQTDTGLAIKFTTHNAMFDNGHLVDKLTDHNFKLVGITLMNGRTVSYERNLGADHAGGGTPGAPAPG